MAGEWITSSDFKGAVRRRLRLFSLEQFPIDDEVLSLLEGLLTRQAQKNIREESRRPLDEQRSQTDAMSALDNLVQEAREVAVSQGRRSISTADITLAYARKFCQFFPFC